MPEPRIADEFPDTRWTLIQRVETDSHALDEWCRGYWRPARDYIRAQGYHETDADELTQEFFARLLSKAPESRLPDQLNGSFRAYLKRSLKNFLTDQWRASHRQRRGGGSIHLDINEQTLTDGATSPDLAFAQSWVLTIIERAASTLEQEMTAAGKHEFFTAVSGCLDGSDPASDRSEIAARFAMNDGTFRVTLHRLRQRFRHLIEQELRQTVSTKDELDEELRYLLSVWS